MPRQTSFKNTQFNAHITSKGKETTRCRHYRDKYFIRSLSDRKGTYLKAYEGFIRHVVELIQKRINGDVEARLDLKVIPNIYIAIAQYVVDDLDNEGVINESRRVTIDRLFTQAILQASMPFYLFSNKGQKDLFKELDYTPPSRDRLLNELLTAAYDDIVKKVTRIINL